MTPTEQHHWFVRSGKIFLIGFQNNAAYGISESVHSGTLKAFVREELEQGNEVDKSVTVFEYGESKITNT